MVEETALGEGNAPVPEMPLGEGNAPVEEPVEDEGLEEEEVIPEPGEGADEEAGEKEIVALGAGWYQVGQEKYHGKAALEEAGYTLEEEE